LRGAIAAPMLPPTYKSKRAKKRTLGLDS
jgi:hypothetical protein